MTVGAPARRARHGPAAPRRPESSMVRALRLLATAAGTGLLLVAATVAAAVALGGERSVPIVLLAALAAWLVPLTLGAAALFAVARHRRSAVVALGMLTVVLAWLRPFPHGNGTLTVDAVRSGRATELTVMSQNVLFGHVPADEVVAAVRDERPDVLVLSELTGELAAGLSRAGLDELLPYRHLAPGGGAGGTGIWSAYPLTGAAEIPGLHFAGLDARVELPGGGVRLLGVHPVPPQNPHWANDFAVLRDLVAAAGDEPLVLAGDLNATQFNAPMRRLLGEGLADAAARREWAWQQPTWPADPGIAAARRDATTGGLPGVAALREVVEAPVLRIDHVLVPESARVLDLRTVRLTGSDHLGLVAQLRLAR